VLALVEVPERTSQRPVASASGIIVYSAEDLARTSQPNPMQKPQWMHAGRPRNGCEAMAMGAGNGCSPSLRAPRSSSTPEDLITVGGIG
jgi:hypothetical protein